MREISDYIEALKTKDEEAFEYIYQQTKHGVYALIVSILKDKELSEDIMQDTYIEMISSIHSYNPKYKFRNWLLMIARNKAIDEYRKRKRELVIDLSTEEYLLPNTPSTADDETRAKYLLSLLDDDERQIVVLHTMDEMKFKDIAFITEKPLGTVMWIYHKAIKKLKEVEVGE